MSGPPDSIKRDDPLVLSHVVPVVSLPTKGREVIIDATEEECAAIARANGLESVESFTARFHATKGKGPLIAVQGTLQADVVQICGVTLEPMEEQVYADITLAFVVDIGAHEPAVEFDVDDNDPPDPVIDGQVDFGAVALEYLTLNLNPYPKKPGVYFSPDAVAKIQESPQSDDAGPFSALSILKNSEN